MENSSNHNTGHRKAPVPSFDVQPDIIGNAHLNRHLQDNFAVKQVVNKWKGPKYPEYCDLIDRVHSFKHVVWPETCPTPASLSEAGFFYDGKLTNFITVFFNQHDMWTKASFHYSPLFYTRVAETDSVFPLRDRA